MLRNFENFTSSGPELSNIVIAVLYNNNIPTEASDRVMFTNPVTVARMLSSKTFHAMARAQPERYEALERAGFKVDPFGDIQDAINIRLGGHYIDVGTSAKIGRGLVGFLAFGLLEPDC